MSTIYIFSSYPFLSQPLFLYPSLSQYLFDCLSVCLSLTLEFSSYRLVWLETKNFHSVLPMANYFKLAWMQYNSKYILLSWPTRFVITLHSAWTISVIKCSFRRSMCPICWTLSIRVWFPLYYSSTSKFDRVHTLLLTLIWSITSRGL